MAIELTRSIIRSYDRFIQYALAGLFGTITHWLLYYILIRHKEYQVLVASSLGFLCGATVNYLLNYYLTFHSEKKHSVATCKFGGVALLMFGLNILLMYIFAILLDMHAVASQVLSTAIVLPIGYMLNKHFTF